MRNLKFRVWVDSEETSKLFPKHIEENKKFKPFMASLEDCYFEESKGLLKDLESIPNVMQWVGIQDENGVDIYEGDIVYGESFERFPVNGVVRFKGGSFYINNEAATFYRFYDYSLEVVGNIFEGPFNSII